MKKILIIDDEDRIREIYIRILVEEGFLVRQASDAKRAFNIMIREPMDLILLDIKMPEINGKTMMEVIKEFDPNMKVIVTSVYPLERQKDMIPGATNYHDKSDGLVSLLVKIIEVLKDKESPTLAKK